MGYAVKNPNFNTRKAIETILYILNNGCDDLYHIIKIVYFADRKHLATAASTMFKETYIAMEYGHVPSGVYDLLKCARDGKKCAYASELPFEFDAQNRNMIKPLRMPDMRVFSRKDIKCLDEAIEENRGLSYKELMDKSHALNDYNSVETNQEIPLISIVRDIDDEQGNIEKFLCSVVNGDA